MTKYLLVSAYARGLALEISHIEFPCLESLKNYLFDNHHYDEDMFQDFVKGRSVPDHDGESWDKLIEVKVG